MTLKIFIVSYVCSHPNWMENATADRILTIDNADNVHTMSWPGTAPHVVLNGTQISIYLLKIESTRMKNDTSSIISCPFCHYGLLLLPPLLTINSMEIAPTHTLGAATVFHILHTLAHINAHILAHIDISTRGTIETKSSKWMLPLWHVHVYLHCKYKSVPVERNPFSDKYWFADKRRTVASGTIMTVGGRLILAIITFDSAINWIVRLDTTNWRIYLEHTVQLHWSTYGFRQKMHAERGAFIGQWVRQLANVIQYTIFVCVCGRQWSRCLARIGCDAISCHTSVHSANNFQYNQLFTFGWPWCRRNRLVSSVVLTQIDIIGLPLEGIATRAHTLLTCKRRLVSFYV